MERWEGREGPTVENVPKKHELPRSSTPGLERLAVDFSFIEDPRLRAIVVEYYREALAAYGSGLYAAALFLSGSVLEGTLTWAMARAAAGSSASETEADPSTWGLAKLIDQAVKRGLIGKTAKDASWAVKDFRNSIHPGHALNQGSSRPDAALSLGALTAVAEIIRSLRGRMPQVPSQNPSGQASLGQESSEASPLMSRLNFAWLVPGRLAGSRGPRTSQDLEDLCCLGIKAIVRLAHQDEQPLPHHQVEEAGFRGFHEPVKDFHAPTIDQIDRVVQFIKSCMELHLPTVVSCGAGYGRTSTVLACYLVHTGITPSDAIAQVSEACKRKPETEEQIRAVRQYEAELSRRRPPPDAGDSRP